MADGCGARDRDRRRAGRGNGERGEPLPDGLSGRQAELPRDRGRRLLDRAQRLPRPVDSDRPALVRAFREEHAGGGQARLPRHLRDPQARLRPRGGDGRPRDRGAAGGGVAAGNLYGGLGGLAAGTENPDWSAGDLQHAHYMVATDTIGHSEDPGSPFYTADGDAAARNSNVAGTSDLSATEGWAVDSWMSGPFHAIGIL